MKDKINEKKEKVNEKFLSYDIKIDRIKNYQKLTVNTSRNNSGMGFTKKKSKRTSTREDDNQSIESKRSPRKINNIENPKLRDAANYSTDVSPLRQTIKSNV